MTDEADNEFADLLRRSSLGAPDARALIARTSEGDARHVQELARAHTDEVEES
ncbi:hypothetical protein [Streptomyces hydrogenans]|uniref:hypothetical protein n=1 Tax=Streptomyces hydrogenans TaxID=1873719 RepID=UPI0035DBB58E